MTTRSLIIAPNWIGDAVMTEPLIRRLNAKNEVVEVVAVPWVAPIYTAMKQVNEVIHVNFQHGRLQLADRYALAKQLRNRFDRAYVLSNSFKSALLPWMANIPERIGYLGEGRYGLLNKRLGNAKKKAPKQAMVQYYSALSGASDIENDRPVLSIDKNIVDATLSTFNLCVGKFIILVPGAEYGPAKRWPIKHFANLILELNVITPIVLLGSSKDHLLCQDIVTMVRSHQSKINCLNLAGACSLTQSMALISKCMAMIGNDSGLMHVAAAFDIPQIALFGSSSPLYTPPLSDKAHIIWLKNDIQYDPPLDCSPCFRKTCPYGHTRCLHDINPERVVLEFNKIIKYLV
jgi:heptosyltransferase II